MNAGFLFALFFLGGAQFLVVRVTAQPAPPELIRIRESKPVTLNDVQFVVVAEGDWKAGKAVLNAAQLGGKAGKLARGVPIEIQLRITNVSKRDLIFSTSSTFGVRMIKEDGTRIMPRGGSDPLISARPVLISKGASFSVCRRAELFWDPKTKASQLVYWYRPGGHQAFAPLHPGRYKLSFWYHVSPDLAKQEGKIRDATPWVGEVVTDEVVIEVPDR